MEFGEKEIYRAIRRTHRTITEIDAVVIALRAVHDLRYPKRRDHVRGDLDRRVYQDVVRELAPEHAEETLVEVHEREVPAASFVDHGITVYAHDDVIASLCLTRKKGAKKR